MSFFVLLPKREKKGSVQIQPHRFSKERKAISKSEIAFSIPRLPGSRPEAVSGYAVKQAGRLSFGHFFSLWSFGALRHFKFDFLALFEGLEAVALNGAVVNEDIRRTWLLNEAIALRIIKPLDLTGYSRHTNESS